MLPCPQFIYSVRNENAKAAMKKYVQILQQAFEDYQNLWEDYIKLQEKYEQSNTCSSFQVKADEPCIKIKESTPRKNVNRHTLIQESSVPLLELDTLNISCPDFNTCTNYLDSSESELRDNENNLSKSPVFSRLRLKTIKTSAKKNLQLFKAVECNKVTADTKSHHNVETVFPNYDKKLKISTTRHVETTFLPDGKKLKQSRLVFHPENRDEQNMLLPCAKLVDTSLKTEQDSAKELSTQTSVTLENNKADEIFEDVIEISPTQKNCVKSSIKDRLRLKRKNLMKQMKKYSPNKSKHYSAVMIKDMDFASSFKSSFAIMKDGSVNAGCKFKNADFTTINTSKINMSNSPIKEFNKNMQNTKLIEVQQKEQPVISKAQNITSNVNEPAYEDETFYLPAEKAANRNDTNDFNLNDTENQPPDKKILLDKFNTVPKRKDVPEQFNTRCRADRAKLNGWDCWECKQYYENLPLSKEELQERKNQCSRHRYKYGRPKTPEGFWDLDFPETMSSTYQ